MEITREFLKEKQACTDGYKWWCENCEGLDDISQIRKLAEHRFDWASWLMVRIMPYKQYVLYAVFCAEQVLDIHEKKHTDDKTPRKAIEAAKKCIADPSAKNKMAAADAAAAAYADYAADAAYAAAAAADAAAAAYAADAASAAAAAYAAAVADAADADYAADAAAYANKNLKQKIINYGISLLENGGM